MRTRILILGVLLFVQNIVCASDNPVLVQAELKSVVVYRNGAELTHQGIMNCKAGNNVITINKVSNNIDINSIQLKTNNNITILGIEFNQEANIKKNTSEKYQQLQDSINILQEKIEKFDITLNTNKELISVLQTNKSVSGNQTGLNTAELIKLIELYKQKTQDILQENWNINDKKKKLVAIQNKLKEQQNDELNTHKENYGVLTLQVYAEEDIKSDISVSYITPQASWTPCYDLVVANTKNDMKVVYKAKISQYSGFDWNKVKLSLSTASPSQYGIAPQLKSWFLQYNTLVRKPMLNANAAVNNELNDVVITGYSNDGRFKKNQSADLSNYMQVEENTLNVNYDIELPYSIPTNGKIQTATLQSVSVGSKYQHYAVPKLDKDVYLLAYAADWEKLNLLPGEANIILEGSFVGKTYLDGNNTQDTLQFTLGRDKKVTIKREKMIDFSSKKFLGSSKQQKFTYEITVKNNKKEAVELLLKDQFPVSTNKDIELELVESSGAEVDKEQGFLTWKLALAAGEQKKVRLSYQVKYPKDQTINLY